MTARSSPTRSLAGGALAVAAVLLIGPSLLWAQEAPERTERERAELPPLTAAVSPEEALAAIKRRAKKILEARREARRLKSSGEFTQGIGHETNPANATSHKSDTYVEESVYLLLSKKLKPTLDWSGTYSGNYLKYLDYGDGDYTDHTLTPAKLRWRPGKMWRVEGWSDVEYNYYPKGKDSTYRNWKITGRVRQNLFDTWYHQFQYEWFIRDYVTKMARDGGGADTRNTRLDVRHRLRYKVGTTVRKALLSVENEYYWNNSNDARTDFYDSQVYKVTGSASGNVTKKLYVSGSYAFERKNYERRTVTGIDAEARYDDKTTLSSSAIYTFNDTWKVSPSLQFDHLGSNESTGEYDNMKYAFTVTASF